MRADARGFGAAVQSSEFVLLDLAPPTSLPTGTRSRCPFCPIVPMANFTTMTVRTKGGCTSMPAASILQLWLGASDIPDRRAVGRRLPSRWDHDQPGWRPWADLPR